MGYSSKSFVNTMGQVHDPADERSLDKNVAIVYILVISIPFILYADKKC